MNNANALKNNLLSDVRVRIAPGRAPVALLRAVDGVTAEALQPLREAAQKRGWQAVPVWFEDAPALQVTGFGTSATIADFLGDATLKVIEEQAEAKPQSASGWLGSRKLEIAGWLNAVGDFSLLAAGLKAKDGLMTLAGGLYSFGAVVLGLYGRPRPDRQLQQLTRDTAEFIQKEQASPLPADTLLAAVLADRDKNPLHRLQSTLENRPADVMLGAYTAGAAAMLGSGIVQKNPTRVGYGVWSLLVKATSFVLPEKSASDANAAEAARPSSLGGLVAWLREKPLRIFGYASIITEALLAHSALKDVRSEDPNKRSSGRFGLFTAGMYSVADLLMATSSKDPAKAGPTLDADQMRSLEAMVGEVIARQPEEKRQPLAQKVAEFLAQKSEISSTSAQIADGVLVQARHVPMQGVQGFAA